MLVWATVALCPRWGRLPSQPVPEEPLQPAPPVLSPKHCAPGSQPEPQGRAKGGWWQNGVPLVSTWAPCLLTSLPWRRQLLLWALLCPWLRVLRCGRQAPFFTFKAFCFQGVLEGLTLTSWDPSVCAAQPGDRKWAVWSCREWRWWGQGEGAGRGSPATPGKPASPGGL